MPISSTPTASEINVELGRAATDPFSIDGAEERALAQVPSGPITFADFIGKSASTPIDSYANYLLFLDTITTAASRTANITIRNSQMWSAYQRFFVPGIFGTMYGSIFAGASPFVTSDSNVIRYLQHLVDTYAEFTSIQANLWEMCVITPSLQTGGSFSSWNRNSYNALSFSSPFEAIRETNAVGYWWTGTQCKQRLGKAASTVITEF